MHRVNRVNYCGPTVFWTELVLTQIFFRAKFVSNLNLLDQKSFLTKNLFVPDIFVPTIFGTQDFFNLIFLDLHFLAKQL